jgi:hypothetical protein
MSEALWPESTAFSRQMPRRNPLNINHNRAKNSLRRKIAAFPRAKFRPSTQAFAPQ